MASSRWSCWTVAAGQLPGTALIRTIHRQQMVSRTESLFVYCPSTRLAFDGSACFSP